MHRLYRSLLGLYPRPYRLAYADLIEGVLLDALHEAPDEAARRRIWLKAFADLFICLPAEHISALKEGPMTLSRYTLIRPLAQQSDHTTYLGRDLRSGRLVAMRVQHPTPERIESYRRNNAHSLQSWQTLDRADLPALIEHFTEKTEVFVYEYVEGASLQEMLNAERAPLPEARLIAYALDVCDLLTYLHTQEPPIIFRDVKPANIRVRTDGAATLVEFGIARPTPEGWQPEETDKIGTEGFAPPEQYQGWVTPASDVYALGATLHYLASGLDPRKREPFTFHEHPLEGTSPGFAEVIAKATARDASERYPTAAAFKQALATLPHD